MILHKISVSSLLCLIINLSPSLPHRPTHQNLLSPVFKSNSGNSRSLRFGNQESKTSGNAVSSLNSIDIRSGITKQLSKQEFDKIWKETGTVPDKLSEIPDSILSMTVQGRTINVNDTLSTSQLDEFPKFSWASEPGALYTFLLEDNDVGIPPGKLVHFLATNIPGNDIEAGDIIFDYIPSAPYDTTTEGDNIDPAKGTSHRYIALVYKQEERIEIPAEKGHVGCTPGVFNRLGLEHDTLKRDYNLQGPISGTFYTASYEAGWAEYWICYFSAAIGQPLPLSIPGINDFVSLGECSRCKKPIRYKNRWYHTKLPYIPLIQLM